jgi:lipopolysaccharide/colanic/teichoic acid biosynthesis glycosyltransferase
MSPVAKRLVDVLLACLSLPIAAPLLAASALAIRLDTPGPVLYHSPRLGRGGHIFGLLRFRTVDLAVPADRPMAQRLSRAGRRIRDLSLDDLPNLFNVLAGDMSLVGPRPTEPERVDLDDPHWQRVLSVRPGMVSYAILCLGREYNASPPGAKLQLELEYVQRQSVVCDLRLLLLAAIALLRSGGNVKARGEPRSLSPS